ncbi:MAG: hypothetical protein AB7I19_13355 [Planctomycetota bacterium]
MNKSLLLLPTLLGVAIVDLRLAAQSRAIMPSPGSLVIRREVAIPGARASNLGFATLTHFAASPSSTPGVFDIIVTGRLPNQIFSSARSGTWDTRTTPGVVIVQGGELGGVNCSPSRNKSIVVSDGVQSSGGITFPDRPVIHTEGTDGGPLSFRTLGCPETSEFAGMRSYCPSVIVTDERTPPAPPMRAFVTYVSGEAIGNEIRCVEINLDPNWRPTGSGTPCQAPGNCGSGACQEVMGFEKGPSTTVLRASSSTSHSILRFHCVSALIAADELPVGLISTAWEIDGGAFRKSLFWSGDFAVDASAAELDRIDIPSGSEVSGSGNSLGGTSFYIRPVPGTPGDFEVVRLDMVALSVAAVRGGNPASLRLVMPHDYPDGRGVMVLFTGGLSFTPLILGGFDGALYLDLATLTPIFAPLPIVDGTASITFPMPPGLPLGLELPVQAAILEFVGGSLIGGTFTNLSKVVIRS